jgi:type VI secretion system protein
MPLNLALHKARGPSDRQQDSRTLGQGRISIGRGSASDWVLQDPSQNLSKQHCIIAFENGRYVLTDVSSNGVFYNGASTRMLRDSAVTLTDGDSFVLGEYLIRVSEVADQGLPAGGQPNVSDDDPFGLDEFLAPPPAPKARPDMRPTPPSRFDPFANDLRARDTRGRDDPFGDLDAEPLVVPATPVARPFGEPPAPAARRAHDPLAPDGDHPPDPFGDDDLFTGKAPLENWSGPSQPDNVDGPAAAMRLPKTLPSPNLDDWDDLLGDTPPGQVSPAPQGELAKPTSIPGPPPEVSAPPVHPPAVTPGRAQAAVTPDMDAGRLLAAFLDGAGVAGLDVKASDPEAYFRMVGELFAMMVTSVRDVLMSRAAIKGEFGVERTMLRSKDNNALKFSVTPADAIGALLQPGRPGYMAPARATQEAFDDIRSHQIAVMAGVQAALFHLLRTFDPTVLEGRLQKGSVFSSLIPGSRQAKLWETFCATYKEIARDADSDFQEVFGREFAKSYNEQIRTAGQKS